MSTKPSTLNEEKEPMPSFLKALNIYSSDILDLEEDDMLDEPFSHISGPITEDSCSNDCGKL